MNRTVFAIVTIVALALCASTQQTQAGTSAAAKAGKTPELQSKIEQAWKDWVKKDRPSADKLLADDAVEIWADGHGPRDKKSTLAGMEAMNISHYALSDFKVTLLGDKSQMASYTARVDFASADPKKPGPSYKLAVTEVWVKRGKEWKLLHYQETEVK